MRTKTFRERSPVLIGTMSILVITALTSLAFYVDRLPFVKQAYDIKAEFADAAGLTVDNQVRVAGIKVGTVKDVELAGDRVLVTMEIDNSTEVPADSTAEIKLATILGTKFVDVDATGGGSLMDAGDTIPLERTKIPYEIYQAANQGTDLLEDIDGPQLNAALSQMARLIRTSREEIGTALRGLNDLGVGLSARRSDLRRMLGNANELTGLLAEEGDELVGLIDSSNVVLASLARKREEVQALLDSTQMMATEVTQLVRVNRGNIDRILHRLHRALGVLEDNVQHLDLAFRYAGPSSRYFGSILIQGPWADIYTCVLVLTSGCEADE